MIKVRGYVSAKEPAITIKKNRGFELQARKFLVNVVLEKEYRGIYYIIHKDDPDKENNYVGSETLSGASITKAKGRKVKQLTFPTPEEADKRVRDTIDEILNTFDLDEFYKRIYEVRSKISTPIEPIIKLKKIYNLLN